MEIITCTYLLAPLNV